MTSKLDLLLVSLFHVSFFGQNLVPDAIQTSSNSFFIIVTFHDEDKAEPFTLSLQKRQHFPAWSTGRGKGWQAGEAGEVPGQESPGLPGWLLLLLGEQKGRWPLLPCSRVCPLQVKPWNTMWDNASPRKTLGYH